MAEVYERVDPFNQPELVRICKSEHLERYYFAFQKINPGDSVLDIACGLGYGSKILGEKASKVVGVDISKEAVSYASTHYPCDNVYFLISSAEDFKSREGFDVIACFETLEHVQSPEMALRNLHDNLKPHGKLYLSVPNGKYEGNLNNFHLHRFERSEIKSLLKNCGFTVEKEYCQSPFVGVVQKMLGKGDNSQAGGNTKSLLHNLPLIPEISAKLYPRVFAGTAIGLYYIARVA